MRKNHTNSLIAAFIIPFYSSGNEFDYAWLAEALKSIEDQTDDRWMIFLVDDASPDKNKKERFSQFKDRYGSRLELIYLSENQGPGNSRNVGIKAAYEKGCSFVLFLDSDDIAHPERVAVTRKIFTENQEVGVVYSSFSVIDEHGNITNESDILPSILEIIQQHKTAPVQGKGVWLKIATETGYINLTSATSVRTELAYKYPFPNERISEDYYTWLVYSASGWEYAYSNEIPAKYRIPANSGSRTRDMVGGRHVFNMIKSIIDVRGFQTALELACKNGEIPNNMISELMVKFCLRKAESMKLDDENEIAIDFYRRAMEIDPVLTKKMQINI